MNNHDHEDDFFENPQEQNKNNYGQFQTKGIFLNRKLIGIIFFIIAAILILIIFRKDFFGKEVQEQKNIAQQEETTTQKDNNNNEVGYEDIEDAEATYENSELLNMEAQEPEEELPQYNAEEESRLNHLRQLEEEAAAALRSPSTITIAARPKTEESQNGSFLIQQGQKPVADYDGNRQESKKNFLMNEPAQKFYQQNFLMEQLSEFELKAGDFIPAIMVTGINSDLPSKSVVAQVSENVFDTILGKNLLIPQGTRIIGTYDSSVTFGQERLMVIWQRLIFPNGKTIGLDNMQGVDLSGHAGVSGLVDNHFSTLLKGVLLSSLLGSAGSITVDKKDWRGAAADGAGQQIVSIGETFAEKALSRQPTIIIETGTRFNITVHSDLILEPYEG